MTLPEPADTAGPSSSAFTIEAVAHRLAELDRLPTADHVTVFEDVHRCLQDALSAIDGS